MTTAAGAATLDVRRYEVTITHPDLAGPLVLEVIGSSREAAERAALMSAVQMYRHPPLRQATVTSREIEWEPATTLAPGRTL